MRLQVAVLVAAFLAPACTPAGPAPAPGAPDRGVPTADADLPGTEPTVRVGIVVDTTEIAVSGTSGVEVSTLGGETLHAGDAGERIVFTVDPRGMMSGRVGGTSFGPVEGPLRARPVADGRLTIGARDYRGGALIRPSGDGRVTAINFLALEEYLLGVVPAEIPADEYEAVKAQAVAARTYAVGHLGNREDLGFDFHDTVADQVYGGVESEHPTVSRAVRQTAGEILTYDGRPILAYYHSTCGGSTAAIEEVWNNEPVPYLKSESDRVPGTDRYYCDTSSRWRWTESWTGTELRQILATTLAAHAGRGGPPAGGVDVDEIEITERTPSNRVGTLRIVADGRTYRIHGDSTRRVLRPELGRLLNSSFFSLEATRRGTGIERLTVSGGGWGHGIGMCQIGAMGRSAAGHDYREILAAYYRGAEITRLF